MLAACIRQWELHAMLPRKFFNRFAAWHANRSAGLEVGVAMQLTDSCSACEMILSEGSCKLCRADTLLDLAVAISW